MKASTRSARRSAWIWSLAAVSLLAVTPPAGAAVDVPLGPPINVPVDGSKAYSPPLRGGVTYRVVATGTYTKTNVSTGQRLYYDAAYCFDEQPARVGGCTRLAPVRTLRFIVRFEGDPSYPFLDALDPATQLPYDDVSHRYEQRFTATRSGRLEAYEFDGGSGVYAQQGNITLQFYGPARKKKRKKRISGCRAARTSSPRAWAAGTCHWEVRYTIEQKGLPAKSAPKPATGFVESETTAAGKVFFNAKPKPGRTSTGRAAGLFVHTDTYQHPINPFLFTEGEVTLTPLTASYRRGGGEARLRFSAVVTGITGVPYSKDEEGKNVTRVGDRAVVLAVVDFPFHRDDVLGTFTSFDGRHAHQLLVAPDNQLRITITPPKQLAGKCRCKA